MKRRFPILFKVIILGIGVSILTAGTALTVSYFNQKNRAEETLINNIDNTLDEAESLFMDKTSTDAAQRIDYINVVRKYIEDTYNTLSDDDKTTLDDYPSFKEYAEHYQDLYPWIYAKGIGEGLGLGLSKDMAEFRYGYSALLNLLVNFQISSGSKSVFLSYNITENNNKTMVFLIDSRSEKLVDQYTEYYHIPGSFYNIKSTDYVVDKEHERHSAFLLDKYYTRFIDIYDYETNPELPTLIASLYVEYDLSIIEKQTLDVFKIELLVLGLTSLALIAIYTVFAYLGFVRNINKLSKVSSEIEQRLINKNMNEIVDIPVKSNDEIKVLAESLTEMEKAIINYVDIINKEAKEKERTNAELLVASKIQLDSLPPEKFDDDKTSVRAFIKTAKEVGGDFYDYFYLDDNRLVVLISDVSGKGIPASLFMMKGKELIKSALQSYKSLPEAINSVNNMLVKNNKELLFITSFIGVIDFKNNEIRYINAGQEKPYIISGNNLIKLDGESNVALGIVDDFSFAMESKSFNKGDYIFMFTDGLNESINDKEEEFGYSRIEEILKETSADSLDEIIHKINAKHEEFTKTKEQFDDVTMLFVKFQNNTLNLHYEKKDFEIISEIVDRFNDSFSGLSNDTKSKAGIIIDEIVNNFISYEKREDLKIDVSFKVDSNGLTIEFKTNGEDYNPFINHKEKYLEGFHSEIEEGGFGLSIIKDLAKSYSYKYEDNHSIIVIGV